MKNSQFKNSNLKKNSFLQPLTLEELGMVYGGCCGQDTCNRPSDYDHLLDPCDGTNGG